MVTLCMQWCNYGVSITDFTHNLDTMDAGCWTWSLDDSFVGWPSCLWTVVVGDHHVCEQLFWVTIMFVNSYGGWPSFLWTVMVGDHRLYEQLFWVTIMFVNSWVEWPSCSYVMCMNRMTLRLVYILKYQLQHEWI